MKHRHTRAMGLVLATALLLGISTSLAAQESGAVRGVVRDAETDAPLAAVLVVLVELERHELSHADGTFHLEGVPPGRYTLRIERLGYGRRMLPVEVGPGEVVTTTVELAPSAIRLESVVVTGMVGGHAGEEAIRPTNVVGGEELARELGGTVAETIENEAGIAVVSMGPATARPVIRGLGGDRILILEDGQRVGDLSATSPDHAVAIDPISAQRVEVVRGTSALLYGSNALGGVVNVVREEIPTSVPDRLRGSAAAFAESAQEAFAGEGGVLVPVSGSLALRAEASARVGDDLQTPAGAIENTDAQTYGAGLGAGWVNGWGHAGTSYRYYDSQYGIPGGFTGGHAEGVDVDMVRHAFKTEAHVRREMGPFSEIELDGVYTRYHHREIESGGILGTEFGLLTAAGEALATHEGWGPLDHGAVGVRAEWRDFATGGSLGTPPARELALSAYSVQELDLGRLRLEFGARYDWHRVEPLETETELDIGDVRTRSFGAVSGSIGALYEVLEGIAVGASLARAHRSPDIGELFSEGPHLAAYSFEVGNPDLEEEIGVGADAFVRVEREALSAEVAGFYNRVEDYLFARNTGRIRVGVGLPIFQFTNADAELWGFEARAAWTPVRNVVAEATSSYVRGTLTDTGEPLPLIPPLQAALGLRYERPSHFFGVGWKGAAEQDRLGPFETATDAYGVFRASTGLRRTLGGRLHTLTLRVENLADTEYRNHLSRIKEIMPEAGRNVSLVYRVTF